MDKKMKQLLDTEFQLHAHEDALEELQQRVARGEAIVRDLIRFLGTLLAGYTKCHFVRLML